MPKSHRPYPPAFRRQMIELIRRGRTPEELEGSRALCDVHTSAHRQLKIAGCKPVPATRSGF